MPQVCLQFVIVVYCDHTHYFCSTVKPQRFKSRLFEILVNYKLNFGHNGFRDYGPIYELFYLLSMKTNVLSA